MRTFGLALWIAACWLLWGDGGWKPMMGHYLAGAALGLYIDALIAAVKEARDGKG